MKYSALTSGATLGGAYLWVATSERRAARWLRRIAKDAQREVSPPSHKPDPSKWSDNAITLAWIGHATVLINFYGIKILTDPALGNQVGVSLGLGTLGAKRYVGPALRVKDLPSIDVLLLSHAHMDHLDTGTLRQLRPTAGTVSARLTSDLLPNRLQRGLTELGWGDKATCKTAQGELEIEAFEVKHWGRRWPNGIDRGYNGYILRREGKALVFGGDTAKTELFRQIESKGPFEFAVMPIAAYRPWIRNHCTPEEAVEMASAAGAKYIVPVHHQAFKLSDEPMDEPIQRFTAALETEPERIALTETGETFISPASIPSAESANVSPRSPCAWPPQNSAIRRGG